MIVKKKPLLSLYEINGRYVFVVKDKITRVCHEELVECFIQALKDISLAESMVDGE